MSSAASKEIPSEFSPRGRRTSFETHFSTRTSRVANSTDKRIHKYIKINIPKAIEQENQIIKDNKRNQENLLYTPLFWVHILKSVIKANRARTGFWASIAPNK